MNHRRKPHDNSELFMDPARDKEKFKHQITETIEDQVPGLDDAEVKKVVSERYEELLRNSTVVKHVPTLIEGEVKSEFRHRMMRERQEFEPVFE